jgi:hypothetical protein
MSTADRGDGQVVVEEIRIGRRLLVGTAVLDVRMASPRDVMVVGDTLAIG